MFPATTLWRTRILPASLGKGTRDDRIVDFHYPILTCFLKIISVSDPIRILFWLKSYYPYPKTIRKCIVVHNIYFVLCLFCLVRQNNCWSYFTFSWTQLVEAVTWQVWNAYPALLTTTFVTAQSHAWMMAVMVSLQGWQAVSSFLFALSELSVKP